MFVLAAFASCAEAVELQVPQHVLDSEHWGILSEVTSSNESLAENSLERFEKDKKEGSWGKVLAKSDY